MEEQTRDCKACIYSKNGKCAGTEECHECMWENKFKQKSYNEVEDCISRQAVHDLIAELLSDYLHDEDREKIEELDVKIEDLEPVTPKEKTAAWVGIDQEPHEVYECNACGWLLYAEDRTDFKYCPNCGARMQEVEENG